MIFPKISCEALIVQSAPSSRPSPTVTAPSVTLTVHWPAPSMSKPYELFMPAVFDVSARDGSVSKNSCTLSGIYRSFSGSMASLCRGCERSSDTIAHRDEGRDRAARSGGRGRNSSAGGAAARRQRCAHPRREARRTAREAWEERRPARRARRGGPPPPRRRARGAASRGGGGRQARP